MKRESFNVISMPQIRKYVHKAGPGEVEAKGKTCNIKGCNNPAVRSLSREAYETYLRDAGLELKSDKERKIMPCDAHYKDIKKKKKKDDKVTKAKFSKGAVSKVGAKGWTGEGFIE